MEEKYAEQLTSLSEVPGFWWVKDKIEEEELKFTWKYLRTIIAKKYISNDDLKKGLEEWVKELARNVA